MTWTPRALPSPVHYVNSLWLIRWHTVLLPEAVPPATPAASAAPTWAGGCGLRLRESCGGAVTALTAGRIQ